MITIAAFTFYKIIIAIIHSVKVKKHNSPLLESVRNINIADAIMSVLPLQSSMIGSFSDVENKQYTDTMTSCVGAGILIALLWLGITMIKKCYCKNI